MNRYLQTRIRYFMAVAEELHFRRASERLHVAQPAVSRAIRQLEAQLGVALLKRNNRNVALTAGGKAFYRECLKAANILDGAGTNATRAASGETGHLAIGYIDFAINGPLPRRLSWFYEAFPDVSIELVRRNSHEQLDDLKSGRLDLGLLVGPVTTAGIAHRNFYQAPYVAVLPQNHPLTKHTAIPLEALADEPFVIGQPDNWRHFIPQLQAYCLAAGFAPRIAQQAPNSDSIFGLIAARMGVTLYPDCDLNHHRDDIAIRPLLNSNARLSIELAWHCDNNNPALKSFINGGPEVDA